MLRRDVVVVILVAFAASIALLLWRPWVTDDQHGVNNVTAIAVTNGSSRDRYVTQSQPTLRGNVAPIPTSDVPSVPILADNPNDPAARQQEAQLTVRRRLAQVVANDAALCFADRDDLQNERGEFTIRFQLTSNADAARLGAMQLRQSSLRQELTDCVIRRLERFEFEQRGLGVFTDAPSELTFTAEELRQKAAFWATQGE